MCIRDSFYTPAGIDVNNRVVSCALPKNNPDLSEKVKKLQVHHLTLQLVLRKKKSLYVDSAFLDR